MMDQLGQRTKIINGLEMFFQMAMMPKPTNFDFLVNNWCKLLKNTPHLEKAFEIALRDNKKYKVPNVNQVIEASKSIGNATLTTAIQKKEPELHPSEYPTPEQHKKAIQTIMAVMDGRVTKEEGKEVLAGIFNGQV